MRPRRLHHVVAVLLGGTLVAACTAGDDVAVERSDRIAVPIPGSDDPFSDAEGDAGDGNAGDTTTPESDGTSDPDGDGDAPAPTNTAVEPVVTDPEAIDFGDQKPVRDRDDYLLAAFTDIETWLAEDFEPAFGFAFEPLRGEVYAGYPERTDPIPGCGPGQESTPYDDLRLFVAFYCPIGDFIAYDDGDGGLLDQLSDEYGPATIGVVLAHEYGHALQERTGVLDLRLPTIVTEQQSDCVAGAWAGRAAAGRAHGVPFGEADVRAALIAMIEVQDPIGLNPVTSGSHGSGFDRVGAFQTGFTEGLGRCAELIDDPLPLTPLAFLGTEDFASGGNAPFGFGEDELFGFLPEDLDLFFDVDLDDRFPDFRPLTVVATRDESEIACSDTVGSYDDGVVRCRADDTVYLDIGELRRLYDSFGDFAPGYLLGKAWADAAQESNGSTLVDEARALRSDCLVGAWVRSATPLLDDNGNFVFDGDSLVLLEPRTDRRTALISPNDLTEAIQTAILIGDESADADRLGSAFEKIDAFRLGALGGVDACG